jgi:hypothetical protein
MGQLGEAALLLTKLKVLEFAISLFLIPIVFIVAYICYKNKFDNN